MAITKSTALIGKWFGNNMWYKEVNEDGTELATPDTWHQLPHKNNGKFENIPVYTEIKADHGQKIANILDEKTPVISGNFMQSDKDLHDFLTSTVDGKFYRILVDMGKLSNGKAQALLCGVCEFTPQFSITAGTRQPAYEIKIRSNDTAITEDSAANLVNLMSEITTNITIGVGEYYYLYQEA